MKPERHIAASGQLPADPVGTPTMLIVTTPPSWSYGRFILGCGTFGGIGGSPKLVGRGLDEVSAFATMDEAVRLNITLFDTAESYARGASETMIGRWLVAREQAVTNRVRLVTKVAPPHGDESGRPFDAAFLDEKLTGSLQRLGVDTVEFLLTHAPDDDTPIEDTLEGLEAIRATGRCRNVGACNVDADELTAALDAAERLGITGYQLVQNGYSLLEPQEDRAVRSICHERVWRSPRSRRWPAGRSPASTAEVSRHRRTPGWRCAPMASTSCSLRPRTTRQIGSAPMRSNGTESRAVLSRWHGFCTTTT